VTEDRIGKWYGKPINSLSREELLDVVEWCGKEIEHLRSDRDRWRESGNALEYLNSAVGSR